MIKKAIIVDLDGCLFDTSELHKQVPADASEWTRDQWDEFQKQYNINFPVIQFIKKIVLQWGSTHSVLFITSREARNNTIKDTLDSLKQCFGEGLEPRKGFYYYEGSMYHYELLMRNNEDYRPSHEVKKDIYTMFIKDRYDVEFAIDDEQQNIDMWVSLGIPSLKVVR